MPARPADKQHPLSTVPTANDLIANLGDADADYVMAVSDALKGTFKGIVVLGASGGGNVALVATISPDFQSFPEALTLQTRHSLLSRFQKCDDQAGWREFFDATGC